MARIRHGGARASRLASPEAYERRLEFERALIDVERVMMQTVQTSLSLIGFGFSIAEFFRKGGVGGSKQGGGLFVGEAMLILGLLLLALGIWTHASYRRHLICDMRPPDADGATYGVRYRDTPSFVIAVLLLLIGFFGLVTLVFRRLF